MRKWEAGMWKSECGSGKGGGQKTEGRSRKTENRRQRTRLRSPSYTAVTKRQRTAFIELLLFANSESATKKGGRGGPPYCFYHIFPEIIQQLTRNKDN